MHKRFNRYFSNHSAKFITAEFQGVAMPLVFLRFFTFFRANLIIVRELLPCFHRNINNLLTKLLTSGDKRFIILTKSDIGVAFYFVKGVFIWIVVRLKPFLLTRNEKNFSMPPAASAPICCLCLWALTFPPQ